MLLNTIGLKANMFNGKCLELVILECAGLNTCIKRIMLACLESVLLEGA